MTFTPPPRPHRRPQPLWLLVVLLTLCTAGSVHGQARSPQKPVKVRDAEEAIRLAQLRMYDVYIQARSIGMPRGNCDELTGEDCFGGDRECQWCVWDKNGRDMIRLGIRYDSVAALAARAGRGIRQDRLDWISAQRVGVWARLRNPLNAERAARECLGGLWLCEGLRGMVEHMQGKYEIAEQRFNMLLRIMPADQACHWRELRLYYDSTGGGVDAATPVRLIGTLPRNHRKLTCLSREETDQFWILSDPMFTIPGNDRMTEHYARLVDLLIHEQHVQIMSEPMLRPGRPSLVHHSKVLRHGWPTEYKFRLYAAAGAEPASSEADDPFAGATFPAPYAGMQHLIYGNGGQTFVNTAPRADALVAYPEMFETVRKRPVETYRPEYGPVASMPVQSGYFREAGKPLLLLRTRAPADTSRIVRAWQVRSWNGRSWRDGRVTVSGDAVIARIETPWQAQVASVEALHAQGAYRARTGNRPPGDTTAAVLSSLVLIDAAAEPASLDDVARAMLPSHIVSGEQQVAGYWELYTSATRTATIELRIRHTSPGAVTRALGIGRRDDHVIRWTEELRPRDGVVARTISLDLTAVESGDYEVSLQMVLDDGTRLSTVTRATRP